MNWGKSITLVFVVFFATIFTVVYKSTQRDVNLVTPDYYEKEIVYETQIEKIRNAKKLKALPKLIYQSEGKIAQLQFPAALAESFNEGEIHFFRTSDATLDFKLKIYLNENGTQSYDLSTKKEGRWKVIIDWKSNQIPYYMEQTIFIK